MECFGWLLKKKKSFGWLHSKLALALDGKRGKCSSRIYFSKRNVDDIVPEFHQILKDHLYLAVIPKFDNFNRMGLRGCQNKRNSPIWGIRGYRV